MGLVLRSVMLGLLPGLCVATALRAEEQKPSRGEELWQTRCALCHPLYPPPTKAPPGMGIVMHYSATHPGREDFAQAVARWVAAPSKERSAMPAHAIERFGLMPPFPYAEDEVKEIARWLWDTFANRGMRRGP